MRLSAVACLSLLIAVFFASEAQAGFGCSASAGRVTVLGQTVEPVTANAGSTECVAESRTLTGPAAGLPAPLTAGAVVAATDFASATKSVVSSGGLADVRVQAPPSIPLPPVVVPDSFQAVKVDLSALKTALKSQLDPLTDLLNIDIVDAVPGEFNVDVKALVAAVAATRIDVELLRVQGAMAYAAGSCRSGAPTLAGRATVAGVSVLGQDLPVDQLVDRVLPVDLATVDPSEANLATVALPSTVAALFNSTVPGAQAGLAAALQSALDQLPDLRIPVPVSVQVRPGLKVQDASSVTQQALNISVAVAGQKLVDAVIGEARISAAGVDCSVPVVDPGTPAGAALGCSTRRLVLVDVLERNRRVRLTGVADPSLAGRTVSIVFNATKRVVARVKVAADGSFDTTAPLPPKRLRSTNDARYRATLGAERSINLKLRRRMVVRSISSENGKVTITGRVVPPLGRPLPAITLKRRVSCTREEVVTRFRPRRNGVFRVTVGAPKGVGTAVYRLTTQVRFSPRGSALFNTFTLPRAVDLRR